MYPRTRIPVPRGSSSKTCDAYSDGQNGTEKDRDDNRTRPRGVPDVVVNVRIRKDRDDPGQHQGHIHCTK